MTTDTTSATDANGVITLAMLDALGACETQRDAFAAWLHELGTDALPVTPDTIAQAHRRGLDVAWLAYNTSTPPEVLATLATDADAGVRRYVAYNTSTPPEVLATLATDADAGVRWGAARNPATPGPVTVP